ncbi:MAG: hypothetical protein JWO51_2339 [Rhodospirillales bacterium]|nr:hypothetical protein [Rhodospirillales bacterium]
MRTVAADKSIPQIFGDLLNQFTTLLSKEAQLARAEVSENITRAAAALALIVGGAVLLIPALVVLLQAAVSALMEAGIAAHWSQLIVGGAVLLIGLVLLFLGVNRLKVEKMIPNRTIHQLQQDASVAKDQMRQRDDLHRAA